VSRDVFRAIWPVVDDDLSPLELLDLAADDLPQLAARHRVEITGRPRWSVQPGWQIPGSGGALLVVVAEMTARRKQPTWSAALCPSPTPTPATGTGSTASKCRT
jgi:hypothetical protein